MPYRSVLFSCGISIVFLWGEDKLGGIDDGYVKVCVHGCSMYVRWWVSAHLPYPCLHQGAWALINCYWVFCWRWLELMDWKTRSLLHALHHLKWTPKGLSKTITKYSCTIGLLACGLGPVVPLWFGDCRAKSSSTTLVVLSLVGFKNNT